MQGQNVEIQSIVIDLLQCLVSRGDVDALTIDTMESAVVTKLFLLVHSERLELQNKLLHLLHSIISISSASAERRHLIRSPNMMQQVSSDTLDTGTVKASMHADPNSPTKIHPLLVNLLIDGIATPSNRRLLHHWLDFVLLTVPQFPYIIATAISPLNACVCRQMRNELTELNAIVASANGTQQRSDTLISSVDDAELVMLLNALERLVLLSLNEMDSSIAEDNSPVDRPGDGAGLLSIVSNVFSNESSNHTSDAVMTVCLLTAYDSLANLTFGDRLVLPHIDRCTMASECYMQRGNKFLSLLKSLTQHSTPWITSSIVLLCAAAKHSRSCFARTHLKSLNRLSNIGVLIECVTPVLFVLSILKRWM